MTFLRDVQPVARAALVSAVAALAFAAAVPAAAQGVIKIGEINSYKAQPAFLEPYKKGMELAVDEINAAGGIDGRKLELITRDDNANPGDAVRVAEELVSREKVDVLTGSFLSNIGLALTDFAKQKKFFFLAAEPLTDKIVWQNGNRYTFRLRPSTWMQVAMLIPDAAAQKRKRWALVYPNYEYGQSAAATFKQLLKAAQPDVEFVAEQATPLGKVDAGSVVQALGDAKPDAIFNVLFGADLTKFVREGTTRGLFKDREVVSLLTGEPEYMDPLKDEAPNGWIVTGYPWAACTRPSTARSSPRTRASGRTIRASARWWATAPSSRSPPASARRRAPTATSSSPPSRACRSTRRSAGSRSAHSTISRRWARSSGALRSRTARA